jgi:hypothetical protein
LQVLKVKHGANSVPACRWTATGRGTWPAHSSRP